MKLLKDILYKVAIESVIGSTEISVAAIHFNSQNIKENDVFVAIKGTATNGHNYIKSAIEKGARVVVCEELPEYIDTSVTLYCSG